MKGSVIVPLLPGDTIKIIYTDNMAVYTFVSRVIQQNSEDMGTVVLGAPLEVKRIQRRNFVRLDCRLKVVLQKLNDKLAPDGEAFTAGTVDVSGGGMMFECDVLLNAGDVLQATLHLNDKDTVRGIGRVIRFARNSSKNRYGFSAGFEFTLIEETERDKIIRFIFNQQRDLRRKGLL